MQTANGVIDRMREASGLNDSKLAELLGVNKSTLSGWRARNSVPLDRCLDFADRFSISLDWLLVGLGPRSRCSTETPNPAERLADTDLARVHAPDLAAGQQARYQAILDWWLAWWAQANPDERAWVERQLSNASSDFSNWMGIWNEWTLYHALRGRGVSGELADIYEARARPVAAEVIAAHRARTAADARFAQCAEGRGRYGGAKKNDDEK